MQQVAPHIYVETELRGCNPGFIVTGEGVVMVDTPVEPEAAVGWREEIAKRGQVRYLINTEPHMDHWAGNYFFPGTVVSQEGTRQAILAASLDEVRERLGGALGQPIRLPGEYQIRAPTLTFSQGLHLYLGKHTLQLIHLGGHTPSQTAVYIPEEGVVFTGDNVFCRVQTYLQDADPDQWLAALDRLQALDARVVVPGHGQVCDKGYLAEQAAFIREWVDAVREAIARGWSREEARERISFLHRYPHGGLTISGQELQRWNVDRLYTWLVEKGSGV